MANIRIPFAQQGLAVSRGAALPVEGIPGAPRISPNDVGQVAGAMREASLQIGQVVEAERRAIAVASTTRANAEYARRLGELEQEFAGLDLTDSSEAAERFRTRGREIASEVARGISFSDARQAWEAGAEGILAPREVNVRQAAYQRGVQSRVADLQTGLETFATAAAAAGNTVERDQAIAQGRAAIIAAREAGDINPAAQRQLEERFLTQISTARVVRAMQGNPSAALAMLNDPAQTPGLDPDRRAQLQVQALNRQDALAARAEAARNRQERAVAIELQQVNGLLSAGVVPEDRVARLQGMARGTIYEQVLPQMVADARMVGQFATMPIERQQATMAEVNARVRAGNATDADLAQQQRLTQVFTAQQRDLDQNGLGSNVARQVIGELPPLDFTNADSLNARVAAAQTMSRHSGRPVAVLTREDTQALIQQFTRGTPEEAVRIAASINQITDGATRAETIRMIEAARGDGGNIPPGTLARIADIQRVNPRAAQDLIASLRVDQTGRTRTPQETTQLNAAVQAAMGSGVLRMLSEQYSATQNPAIASVIAAEQNRIRQIAQARIDAGESPDEAVRSAVRLSTAHLNTLTVSGEAAVRWPVTSGVTEREMRTGLRALRDEYARGITIPEGEAGAGDAARRRQAAARSGVWVTTSVDGNEVYALVGQGEDGRSAVLFSTTLDRIRDTARGVTRRDTVDPPPVRTQRTIETRERERREGERLRAPPVMQ